MVAANGFCVTDVGTEFFEDFDDIDMVDNVLARFEFLRAPLLKKFKGILLWCDECLVDDMSPGWHIEVSYKKGMIGCWCQEFSGQKANAKVLEMALLFAQKLEGRRRLRGGADSIGA